MFSRLLIANRGEIALRIIRAARELGIETICVYSDADRGAPWLDAADEVICIGPGPAGDSYLKIDRIIAAAEVTHAEAIHPGYGFLAESADFAEVCQECEIVFIGPSPAAMGLLGDKISCKKLARGSGTPIFPGSDGAIESIDEAVSVSSRIGYPVIIKSSAGGGGRGMRIVHRESQLIEGLSSAQQESRAAFGSDEVFIEKFLERARHVEVQCLGDTHGNAIHLYSRDCTSQRRHQKLIEEAPAPAVDEATFDEVATSAAGLIGSAQYAGAATVEFLLDEQGKFFLLEVNTRIQVEHPVTEMVTGIDIMKETIRIACGEPLSVRQEEVVIRGHAIECRINAEDPDRGFIPQPGRIEELGLPGGPGVRVDTHIRSGYQIPQHYDSLLAKLIVHAPTREEAISRMQGALCDFHIQPIRTTTSLHARLLASREFRDITYDIYYVERLLEGD